MPGRRRRSDAPPPPLPVHRRRRRRFPHSVSCWYCDFKITAFNDLLFDWGRKHARFLRVWFSIGVGFSFTSIIAAVFILLGDLVVGRHMYQGSSIFWNLSSGAVFGLSPSVPGWSFSVMDAVYLIASTAISVFIHEFGHALSAASEGVQIEYIALFLAILLPGALVALSHELLQNIPRFAELRIYCAGIWHNAMVCILCGLALLFLPLILSPFYLYTDNPLVLGVKAESPLSGYLSSGDAILAVNDFVIHSPQEWRGMMHELDGWARYMADSWNSTRRNFINVYGEKGYCIPHSWKNGGASHPLEGSFTCSDGLAAFKDLTCSNLSMIDGINNNLGTECILCFPAKDIINLQKCGRGSVVGRSNESSLLCLQEESCMVPVQLPGVTWVEITYASADCLVSAQNSSVGMMADAVGSNFCKGTFVFVGDLLSVSQSVHLTSFWPRWGFKFAFFCPNVLENILSYTFRVSMTLALLNSMPVFFLDGQQILEAALFYVTWFGPSWRRRILRTSLTMGSILSSLALARVIFFP